MYRNMNQTGLEFEYIGPWLIIERVSWVEYRIQLIEDSKVKRVSNIEHLKYFYSREFEANDLSLPDKFNDYLRKAVPETLGDVQERGRLFDG